MYRVYSLSWNNSNNMLFFLDYMNWIARKLSFDPKTNDLISSTVVLGIPYTTSTGQIDDGFASPDPNKVRFDNFYGYYFKTAPEGSNYTGNLYFSNYRSIRKLRLGTKENIYGGTETVFKNLAYTPYSIFLDESGNFLTTAFTTWSPEYLKDAVIIKIDNSGALSEILVDADLVNVNNNIVKPSISYMAYLNGLYYLTDLSNHVIWSFDPNAVRGENSNYPNGTIKIAAGAFEPGIYPLYGDTVDADTARFISPSKIAVMNGRLYVLDSLGYTISEITPNEPKAKVKRIAGNGLKDHVDGIGDKASFDIVSDIAPYKNNQLLITEMLTGTVRLLDTATNEVTTITGQPYILNHVDGDFGKALFMSPNSAFCVPELDICLEIDVPSGLRILK